MGTKPQGSNDCLSNSFTPDTPVLMADGTTKPISQVEAGDQVAATDPATGETSTEHVTAVITGTGDKDLVTITIEASDGSEATLTATTGHPFWVDHDGDPHTRDGTWTDAQHLTSGDWLTTPDGTLTQVTETATRTQHADVHNLTIANTHTYYVVAGDAQVLVHNCNTPKGFGGKGDYNQFVNTLNSGLSDAGYRGTTAAFQGSSVTGVSFKSGRAFGSHSDYDIALGGRDIFSRAAALGIPLRSGGTRTGPLKAGQLEALGLSGMRAQLSGMAGRPVNFMIYESIEGAMARSPSLLARVCGC